MSVGIGTYRMQGSECRESVVMALQEGYRAIDTAMIYANHVDVGSAIKIANVPKDELYVTTKVIPNMTEDGRFYEFLTDDATNCVAICNVMHCMKELMLDYIDVVLVHWEHEGISTLEVLRGLQVAIDCGFVGSLGVSNCQLESIKRLLKETKNTGIFIKHNQLEINPYNYQQQKETIEFCQSKDIKVTAHTPFANGSVFQSRELDKLSKEYNIPVCQMVLKWLMYKDLDVIPKTANRHHMILNRDCSYVELPDGLIEKLDNF